MNSLFGYDWKKILSTLRNTTFTLLLLYFHSYSCVKYSTFTLLLLILMCEIFFSSHLDGHGHFTDGEEFLGQESDPSSISTIERIFQGMLPYIYHLIFALLSYESTYLFPYNKLIKSKPYLHRKFHQTPQLSLRLKYFLYYYAFYSIFFT